MGHNQLAESFSWSLRQRKINFWIKFVMEEEKSIVAPELQLQGIPKDGELNSVARRVERCDESSTAATRKELYSYYAYYAGNNGIGSFQ